MADQIIKELWEIKDSIAKEHEYDVEAFVAHLQAKERAAGREVVDLASMMKAAKQGASADTNDPHC